MTKQTGKYIAIVTFVFFFIPQLVSAAWWNPVSWNFWPWNKQPEIQREQKPDSPVPPSFVADKIPEPAKPVVNKPAPTKIVAPVQTPPAQTQNGVTDADRQRFGYKGKTYEQTLNQVIEISSVDEQTTLKGMRESEAFKLLMEDLMNKYEATIQQTIQTAQIKCIMAPTPEKERTFDPATQDYLRKLRCGTATATDETNYNLTQNRSTVTTISLPAPQMPFFPTIKPLKAQKWQIRWEGNGVGTLITPNGQQRFHCESSGCQSY